MTVSAKTAEVNEISASLKNLRFAGLLDLNKAVPYIEAADARQDETAGNIRVFMGRYEGSQFAVLQMNQNADYILLS